MRPEAPPRPLVYMMLESLEKYSPIALPYPHFMALAPLDVWGRLLLQPQASIPPRYWLRLAGGLFTSSIGTAITLPERLALAPILRAVYHRSGGTLEHGPGAVCVLGYFRSGTTHLQYMLNCDPNLYSPTWSQALASPGFVGSWLFLRLFLIPFLSQKRPQDDVSFGPEWPAEDDFALNNWSLASSLPARLVLPSKWNHYARYHELDDLSEPEFKRWRFTQWAFLWKISKPARDRRLLLKSPSHTARVPDLLDLFGPERIKFIHIRRDPADVIRSNVAMLKRFAIFHLERPPDDRTIERRIIDEYRVTEHKYRKTRELIPEGNLVEMSFDDLRADPLGQMRRAYERLDLEWTDEFEQTLLVYLHSIRDYQVNAREPITKERAAGLGEEFRELIQRYEAEQTAYGAAPARVVAIPAPRIEPSPKRVWPVALGAAIVCAVLWWSVAAILNNRYDWLVWPTGVAIGHVTLRASRIGSARRGALAAALTLLTLLAVAIPNSWTVFYRNNPDVTWAHLWETTQREVTAGNTIFYAFMGVFTAWRFGSRLRVYPPRARRSRYHQRLAAERPA